MTNVVNAEMSTTSIIAQTLLAYVGQRLAPLLAADQNRARRSQSEHNQSTHDHLMIINSQIYLAREAIPYVS